MGRVSGIKSIAKRTARLERDVPADHQRTGTKGHRERGGIVNLAKKTMDELIELEKTIADDPKNKNPSGSFFIYTKRATSRMDAIRREIACRVREKRIADGRVVDDSGYSGRNSNR